MAGINLIGRPKTKARAKFERGPAKATFASPYFLSRKLKGLIGTGFAQPKIIPLPAKIAKIIKIRGRKTEPIISKCFMGFNVNLPASRAVVSPNSKAATPWETSCKTTEKRRTRKKKTNVKTAEEIIFKYFINSLFKKQG